jgi:hypothetical protein
LGPSKDLLEIYLAATRAYLKDRPSRHLYLDRRVLPHTAGYGNFPSGDSLFLSALAARSGFAGLCDSEVKGACERVGGKVLTLSRLYRIGPDSVRTFILYHAMSIDSTFPMSFAAEDVLLLTRDRGKWRVVGRRTTMIT